MTTTDKLFQYVNDVSQAQIDPATKEALRYRQALKEGFDAIMQYFKVLFIHNITTLKKM